MLEPHTCVQSTTNTLMGWTKTALTLNGAAPEVQQCRKYPGVFGVGEAGKFSQTLVLFLTLPCFETAKKVLISPILGVAVTHVFFVL